MWSSCADKAFFFSNKNILICVLAYLLLCMYMYVSIHIHTNGYKSLTKADDQTIRSFLPSNPRLVIPHHCLLLKP